MNKRKISVNQKIQKLRQDLTSTQQSCLETMRMVNMKSTNKVSELELVNLCNKLTKLGI